MKPVTVSVPRGIPGRYRDAVRRVAEFCTVHHTLTHQPDIAVEITDSPVTA